MHQGKHVCYVVKSADVALDVTIPHADGLTVCVSLPDERHVDQPRRSWPPRFAITDRRSLGLEMPYGPTRTDPMSRGGHHVPAGHGKGTGCPVDAVTHLSKTERHLCCMLC